MLYIESEIHRAVIGEDSSYLGSIRNKEKNARERLLMLKPLLLSDSTKGLMWKLDSLIEEKLQFGNNVLNALLTKGQSAAEEMYKSRKGKNTMGEIANLIDLLTSSRRQYLTQLAIDANMSGLRAREWGIFLAITAGLACIFTFWYITRRIKRQQQLFDQLNESDKKIREAGIIKENFMANMSHEIRTPMNAILGFTNLLQKEPLNEKSQEFVNSIQNSGENLMTIINDVLDFSKIEAGMMRIESNAFSLRGLLHSVETMFATRVQPKNLRLTLDVEKSIPDLLKGDAVRLTQIMVNLVNNSVKFTNSGGIDIRITAGKRKEHVIEVSFSIKDTGIGIPPDKMAAIFERFQQADEDTTRKYGGTGLGLSIVKQLVELQNGTITVSSIQNVGSEFVFTLPYTISKEITERDSLKFTAAGQMEFNVNNVRILVAEDNAMNQSLMKHLLAGWNLDFDIVNSGRAVIEALQQKKYSLILMDIQMPHIDGYHATEKIRNELNSDIPIIAMTAHAMVGEREKCLSYGMNEYISKPIREDNLFKIINNFLSRNNGGKFENQPHQDSNNKFTLLNLSYLKGLSGSNKAFEVTMIEQFLQQLPAELTAIENEFSKGNYTEVAQIAHNMKTTISFMGLTEKIGETLDCIENNASIRTEKTFLKEKITELNNISRLAFAEAERYLKHIN